MTLRDVLRPHFLNPVRLGRIVAYLPQFVRLFYRLFSDPRVPILVKLVPVLGLVLAISPPNLELEIIPVLGELDFVLIMLVALKVFVWLCPPDVVREHVARIAHRG
jgi:uncharacterized membrane protein YkvA (DUF1232 family)